MNKIFYLYYEFLELFVLTIVTVIHNNINLAFKMLKIKNRKTAYFQNSKSVKFLFFFFNKMIKIDYLFTFQVP